MNAKLNIESWLKYAVKRPLEFTIQYPQDPKYFQQNFKLDKFNIPSFNKSEKSVLYFHIPFCKSKCSYCNFAVDTTRDIYDEYIDALIKEFEYKLNGIEKSRIIGIDVGGGTPTIIPLEQLERLFMNTTNKYSSTSVNYKSIETTPQIAAYQKEKIELIKSSGFRRISVGLQSSHSSLKLAMNRKDDLITDKKAIENIYNVGIERLNIDLIFGLPNQTKKDWLEDIQFAVSLEPTSITIYDCLYSREKRSFKNLKSLPTLNFYGVLYDLAYDFLIKKGYFATYGSENFSNIKNENGTSNYFEGRILKGLPYIGLGNYATSQIGNNWWFNTYNSRNYIKNIQNNNNNIQDFYLLPDDELMAKFILSNLNYGVINRRYFLNRFGREVELVFPEIFNFLTQRGWMNNVNDEWILSEGHFNKINLIKSLFYTNGMKEWMLNNDTTKRNKKT